MEEICRLCLGYHAKQNIFGEDSTIHEKLLSYCKLKISKNDGLPKLICKICVEKLENVVTFIDKCEESDKLLRNSSPSDYASLRTVKHEPYSDYDNDSIKNKDSDDENFPSDYKDISKFLSIKQEDDETKDNLSLLMIKQNEENSDILTDDDSKESKANKKYHKVKKIKLKSTLKKVPSSGDVYDSVNKCKEILVITKCEEVIEIDSKINILTDDKFEESVRRRKSSNQLKKRKLKNSRESEKKDRRNRNSKYSDESQLCFTCGKSFPRANYLRQHILKHAGITHKCGQCPKTFATKELMRVHERRHIQIKNVPCEVCGHTFTSGYLARKHFRMVHEKNYAVPCKLCNRTLSNKRSLSEHMKIHTGEKNFECLICNKKFAHKLSLVCHTRVHTGEQPYACHYCEKRFSILKSLKEHERLHTGEKPYCCPLCPKRFEQLGNMKSHFRYNHKGLDLKKVLEAKAAVEASQTISI